MLLFVRMCVCVCVCVRVRERERERERMYDRREREGKLLFYKYKTIDRKVKLELRLQWHEIV